MNAVSGSFGYQGLDKVILGNKIRGFTKNPENDIFFDSSKNSFNNRSFENETFLELANDLAKSNLSQTPLLLKVEELKKAVNSLLTKEQELDDFYNNISKSRGGNLDSTAISTGNVPYSYSDDINKPIIVKRVYNEKKIYGNIKKDVLETIEAMGIKGFLFLSNPLGDKKEGILHGLNDAGITPNNIVAFRTLILMPLGILFVNLGYHSIGMALLSTSCALDGTDGALARKFGKTSRNGEVYDAGGDKVTETGLSIASTQILYTNGNEYLAIAYGILTLIKFIQHIKSQFRAGRPSIKEQLKIFYYSTFRDQNTIFEKKKSSGAATNAGKTKTALQFISSLGIMGVETISDLLDFIGGLFGIEIFSVENTRVIKTWLGSLFTGLSGASTYFGYLSIKGKK